LIVSEKHINEADVNFEMLSKIPSRIRPILDVFSAKCDCSNVIFI